MEAPAAGPAVCRARRFQDARRPSPRAARDRSSGRSARAASHRGRPPETLRRRPLRARMTSGFAGGPEGEVLPWCESSIRYPGVGRYSIVRLAQRASFGLMSNLVKILLSNDDGYRAEGLEALRRAIAPLGSVTIVAPDRNRSGASNSLTLDVPVRAVRYDPDCYFVTGTPTDCVHLAVSGLFDFEHDIVVSGVNDGANLGDDTLYSGTVAAAGEGRCLGLPAIAVSLCLTPDSPRNFASAAQVAAQLVRRMAN